MKEISVGLHTFWESVDGKKSLFVAEKMGKDVQGVYKTTDIMLADWTQKKMIVVPIEIFRAEVLSGKIRLVG